MADTPLPARMKGRLLHQAGGLLRLLSLALFPLARQARSISTPLTSHGNVSTLLAPFRLLPPLLLTFLIPCTARADDTLKLTTWNLNWLTLRPASDPAVPPDIPARTAADFAALRHYANLLHSDIIAFEEVDGPRVAGQLFPPQDYDLVLTPDPVIQRVGLAVRHGRGLSVTVNPELAPLNVYPPTAPHPLRGGLDVTLQRGSARLRLLVVHLKSGCWAQPLTASKPACRTLYRQFHILENWILDRQDDNIPFAMVGDFNRRLTRTDPLMQALQDDAPLTLTTTGLASPCHGGEQFIDHILLGNQARSWLVPGSLRVMTFQHAPEGLTLSDHCPLSVRLAFPPREPLRQP